MTEGSAHLHDSIATRAFADARALLADRELADRRTPLPLSVTLSTGPSSNLGPLGAPGRADEPKVAHPSVVAQAEGRTTARELTEHALARIAEADGPLHAIVALDAEAARADADQRDREREAGHPLGPLHGLPLTVKDVIDVAGLPTRAGSDAYADDPVIDAAPVARLRRAGAVLLAKTSTHEFALGVTSPQSRNPHDPTRIPGGSSGGSAIAVVTSMGVGSLGTDTRASIRVPAALSGCVGFKPTLGRVPTAGVVTLSWTMDHVAPMARTVADAALLLDVLLADGSRLATATSDGVDGLRVGVPAAAWEHAEPAVGAACEQALAAIVAAGAVASPCPGLRADHLDTANAAGMVISRCEAATFHRGIGTDLSRCWPEVADQLEAADSVPATEYLAAQRVRAELMADLGALFAEHDVLAMPTVPIVAPPVDDFARYLMVLARNAIPWSLVGFPAISVPCGSDGTGLPVGLQLVAPPWEEGRLVAAATAVEASLRA